MLIYVLGKAAYAVSEEKAHGEPGGIRRETEKVYMLVGEDEPIQPIAAFPRGKGFKRRRYVGLLHAAVFRNTEYGIHSKVCRGIIGIFRPTDYGGVAYDFAAVTVGEKCVERGGIGKRGVFAYGSVSALLVTIGAEGRGIERYESSSGTLCARHAFYGGVCCGDGGCLPGDKALRHCGVRVSIVIMLLPCVLNRRILGYGTAAVSVVVAEYEICVVGDIFPTFGKQRMCGGEFRLPCVKECEHSPRCRRIDAVQQRVVQRSACFKALHSALRLAFLICAENIGRVIAEKVCRDTGGAFDMSGDAHLERDEHGFLAAWFVVPLVDDVDKLAAVIQFKPEADLESLVPARRGGDVLFQHRLIVRGQSL